MNELEAPVAVRRKPGRPPRVSIEADFTPHEESAETSYAQFLRSPDEVIRHRYSTEVDKNQANYELGRIRRIWEIAAEQVNLRNTPDESKCLMCKRDLQPGSKITMMANIKDDASGVITTHPICSIECVRSYNRERMGLAQVPDQGHVK